MSNFEPVFKGNYDVIVVGGGIAGVSASVAAVRGGASVLLIEKSINLGGLATSGLISWYEPLCDGKGKQMVFGIAEELIKLCGKYGFDTLPEKWGGDGRIKARSERYSTFFSPSIFALALDEYVLSNGVALRFDTLATYPVMNDGHCKGVIVESASGRERFNSKFVIDATGDAAIMHRAGVPTELGENYMTYIAHWFEMKDVANLNDDKDICKFRHWLNAGSDMFGNGHPENLSMLTGGSAENITDYIIKGKTGLLNKLRTLDKNSYDLMTLPTMPQFRMIRRIIGKEDFNAIDGKGYENSIGDCGDFRPSGKGKHYQIPAGALYNDKFDNLIAAGRIISSPKGDGWEVSRVIPNCALTGEAAGKMAAVCIKENKTLNQLNTDDFGKIRVNASK